MASLLTTISNTSTSSAVGFIILATIFSIIRRRRIQKQNLAYINAVQNNPAFQGGIPPHVIVVPIYDGNTGFPPQYPAQVFVGQPQGVFAPVRLLRSRYFDSSECARNETDYRLSFLTPSYSLLDLLRLEMDEINLSAIGVTLEIFWTFHFILVVFLFRLRCNFTCKI